MNLTAVKGHADAEGKVPMRDLATGAVVRLWAVDAAEALSAGSHELALAADAAPAAPAPSGETLPDNLEELKAAELLELAQARGIEVPAGAKKKDLLAALVAAVPPADA